MVRSSTDYEENPTQLLDGRVGDILLSIDNLALIKDQLVALEAVTAEIVYLNSISGDFPAIIAAANQLGQVTAYVQEQDQALRSDIVQLLNTETQARTGADTGLSDALAALSNSFSAVADSLAGYDSSISSLAQTQSTLSQAITAIEGVNTAQGQTLSSHTQTLSGLAQAISGINDTLTALGQTNTTQDNATAALAQRVTTLEDNPASGGGGGGATTFLELTDTPSVFGFGTAGKFLAVNAGADALELVDAPAGGGDTGGISDAPSDGKQYARKDAAWSEVVATGGATGNVQTKSVSQTLITAAHSSSPGFAWTPVVFPAPATDPYGFSTPRANNLTVPVGVTKVRMTVNLQANADTGNNQWNLFKNGVRLTVANGGFVLEQPDGDYANGGVSGSVILDVVAGDYFSIQHYTEVSNTYAVNFTMEALTHTLSGSASTDVLKTTKTAAYTLANADLGGRAVHMVNSATAVAIALPMGLTAVEPITFIRKGAGAVTIAPVDGITLNSVEGKKGLRLQYSSMTLIPEGNNVYTLIGDLV